MPNSSTQHALARRALIEDIKANRRGWLQHGLAALAVSVLGLGVAGSVVFTGAAQQTAPRPGGAAQGSGIAAGASADGSAADGADADGGTSRTQASPAKLQSLADQRAEELSKADDDIDEAAQDRAADARQQLLASASKATQKQAVKLAEERKAPRKAADDDDDDDKAAGDAAPKVAKAEPKSTEPSAGSCLPVAGGYRVAARFGQVGSWSRYHTGHDYSAPVGTPLKASAAGVVTNAGAGSASGWAGNYVAIKHADGSHSMLSHMSTVSVSVGQTVSPCQVVGAIGMTGRTFGPHVHFEVYPAGVAPGDVYKAVDPSAWLSARNLRP